MPGKPATTPDSAPDMAGTPCLDSPSGPHVPICAVCTERMPTILGLIAAEMSRQRELHPVRPRHPYEWAVVSVEEALEVTEETLACLSRINAACLTTIRLSQDQATGATVDLRLDAARRLRTELIQVSAVCAAWAETLPGGC